MELKLIFAFTGIILTIWSFIHYFWSIKKWNTKPHVFTWLIFTLWLWTTFFIQKENGWGAWTYIILASFICCFVVFLLAYRYGEKNITFSDKCFLTWGILALISWAVFKQPFISVILIILIDLFAILPTYRKTWNRPFEETTVMYATSGIIYILSLLAIENYSFLTTWHQIAIITFDFWLVIYILIRRKVLQWNKTS